MKEGRQRTDGRPARLERADPRRTESDAARKRAAVEMIAAHEPALKRTARRYSLAGEDAEDAYQRALEIALTKAPTTDPRELIRWTQTVTKHEALAIRQSRERLLGYHPRGGPDETGIDPIALIAASGDGPDEQVERREAVARSREALRALKPAELRALGLLAEGYSYAEIGELTGFSQTKVNRVLAEGRDRFRSLIADSEDGSRCRELRPLLSAFCDGEASARDSETVREHLRACGRCRATMRAYRAAPRIAIALAPTLPPSRSLLERAHDLLAGLGSRLPGIGGADSTATQVAVSGGSRGVGVAGLAKLLALCAGTAGGAAACVATGVLPAPDLNPGHSQKAPIERAAAPIPTPSSEAVQYEPAPAPQAQPKPAPKEETDDSGAEAATGATEYEPQAEAAPPPPPPAPAPQGSSSSSSGSAAGEFGP